MALSPASPPPSIARGADCSFVISAFCHTILRGRSHSAPQSGLRSLCRRAVHAPTVERNCSFVLSAAFVSSGSKIAPRRIYRPPLSALRNRRAPHLRIDVLSANAAATVVGVYRRCHQLRQRSASLGGSSSSVAANDRNAANDTQSDCTVVKRPSSAIPSPTSRMSRRDCDGGDICVLCERHSARLDTPRVASPPFPQTNAPRTAHHSSADLPPK
jgi:hypothetical protein